MSPSLFYFGNLLTFDLVGLNFLPLLYRLRRTTQSQAVPVAVA